MPGAGVAEDGFCIRKEQLVFMCFWMLRATLFEHPLSQHYLEFVFDHSSRSMLARNANIHPNLKSGPY
jgi:hypothetical protein